MATHHSTAFRSQGDPWEAPICRYRSSAWAATIVRLMETTYIRIGNQEYARQNKSYGLTTMRGKHVEVHGSAITFSFQGKSGVHHAIDLEDRRLARIVRRCQDLPGYELFQYLDADGERHTIDSTDVNDYLREMTGQDFTAKDFRTWAGTVLTCAELQALENFESETQSEKECNPSDQGSVRSARQHSLRLPEMLCASSSIGMLHGRRTGQKQKATYQARDIGAPECAS